MSGSVLLECRPVALFNARAVGELAYVVGNNNIK